ncbi:hypothetical protein sce1341 [Sorangium cellulosum So ce56]|uniref:Uncharacterized protein n=1 Tax=Sorangium cellulosum (strain So ce56) TaxID=448385 RepID=A9F738_SORC5|nr:hypothetical protein [Sorangium cellulosum]CAN91499.1 hypothetical protein sce1341 [Sorangium cellulosum So ce56]
MRRARQALRCGISPLPGILFSAACVEETLPPEATAGGSTGNLHETSGAGEGGAASAELTALGELHVSRPYEEERSP